jgi:hypothetical protein
LKPTTLQPTTLPPPPPISTYVSISPSASTGPTNINPLTKYSSSIYTYYLITQNSKFTILPNMYNISIYAVLISGGGGGMGGNSGYFDGFSAAKGDYGLGGKNGNIIETTINNKSFNINIGSGGSGGNGATGQCSRSSGSGTSGKNGGDTYLTDNSNNKISTTTGGNGGNSSTKNYNYNYNTIPSTTIKFDNSTIKFDNSTTTNSGIQYGNGGLGGNGGNGPGSTNPRFCNNLPLYAGLAGSAGSAGCVLIALKYN